MKSIRTTLWHLPMASLMILTAGMTSCQEPRQGMYLENHYDDSTGISLNIKLDREGDDDLTLISLLHPYLVTEADSGALWRVDDFHNLEPIHESYEMKVGKRLICSNDASVRVYTLSDDKGHRQKLELRHYTDGITFRYTLASGYDKPTRLIGEATEVALPCAGRRWMQRWTEPYEDFFPCNPEEKAGKRWAYPALFEMPDSLYILMTEADVMRGNSASCIYSTPEANRYRVVMDQRDSEVSNGWKSPWRVLISGTKQQLVASTLVTDVSTPCALTDTAWIKPGVVSWIYWAYNHGSNDYQIVCQYVDMAAQLHLPYVLIDAEWDEMGNGGNIEDALEYAHQKGVRPLIWYNSSTAWINGAPGPKFRLNDPETREKEFAWCEEHGVAGVKIDFFQGDRECTMNYCIDLLEAAARHHLLVNFHGATLPRGWQRTYPNLVSTEAVYGAEWYNNLPVLTNRAAAHNATLPFTRGIVGSMDYTPCTFTDSQHPHITSHAHELALTVLFESGLQHLADRPSSYLSQPEPIRAFFMTLPSVWDDTRLLSGSPAHDVVLMRQRCGTTYVAGINGTDEELTLQFDTSALPDGQYLLIEDSGDSTSPWKFTTLDKASLPSTISTQARGGFVMVSAE